MNKNEIQKIIIDLKRRAGISNLNYSEINFFKLTDFLNEHDFEFIKTNEQFEIIKEFVMFANKNKSFSIDNFLKTKNNNKELLKQKVKFLSETLLNNHLLEISEKIIDLNKMDLSEDFCLDFLNKKNNFNIFNYNINDKEKNCFKSFGLNKSEINHFFQTLNFNIFPKDSVLDEFEQVLISKNTLNETFKKINFLKTNNNEILLKASRKTILLMMKKLDNPYQLDDSILNDYFKTNQIGDFKDDISVMEPFKKFINLDVDKIKINIFKQNQDILKKHFDKHFKINPLTKIKTKLKSK